MTEASTLPAGWYQHPGDPTVMRHWDGRAWTGHTAPTGTVEPARPLTQGGDEAAADLPPALRTIEERRRAGVPLLIVLAVLVLGGIGVAVWSLIPRHDDMSADIPAIEQEIVDGMKEQNGADVTVTCPDSIDWKVGGEFHCVVEAEDGSRAEATVSMENDEGYVTWRVE